MSDGWGRPADDAAHGDRSSTVDVPLVSADTAADDRPTDRSPIDRRRLSRIALAGGVAIGATVAAVAAVRSASDDGDRVGSAVSTADAAISAITTPPTLRPLETLPLPDLSDGSADDAELQPGDPPGATFEAPPPPESVVVPTYPPAPDSASAELVDDIATAIDRHDDDIARRSDTHVELGYGGYVLDVSIVRDPERDRYLLEFVSRGTVEVAIVDVTAGTTYIEPGTQSEIRIPNGDITGGTDANEYFDRLLRGPVRSETYDPVATRRRGTVTIDGVGDVREFITRIDGELAPEWQIYAFGPVGEFVPAERPGAMDYSVYVDGKGRIVQVDGVSMLGSVPQLVRHRLRVLDEPIDIELPGDSTSSVTAVEDRG